MESDEARIARLELEKAGLVKAIVGLITTIAPDPDDKDEYAAYEAAIQEVEAVTGKPFTELLESLP